MKIAIISIFREGWGGGCGRVAHDMAEHFAGEHDILLIHPDDETALNEHGSKLRILTIQSVGEGNAAVPVMNRKTINVMFDTLDDFAPAIVHAHEPISLGLMGQVWAAMHDVPFVYTAHVLPTHTLDFGTADLLKFFNGGVSATLTEHVMRDFYDNCDAVIALNDAAAADIRKFGYKGRLMAIPNARDMDRLSQCPVAQIDASTTVLSFVGSINQRKNQGYLVEMLQHLPDNYLLQIIGSDFSPQYAAQIKQMAQDAGRDNVIFTGPVPYSVVPDYLARTHVFVSASTMEVQSLSIIEALASGTPVVGLSNETVDELIDESVGCWLPADTAPADFAMKVQALCVQPQSAYEQMCAASRQRVAHLSWARIRELTTAAYADLIDAYTVFPTQDDAVRALIDKVHSSEVRYFLKERLELIEAFEARMYRYSKLNWITKANTKRLTDTTWMYVGANRLVSSVAHGVSQIEAAFS